MGRTRCNGLRARLQGRRQCPMKTRREELQGVITVHFRQPHTPTDRDLRYLDLYARMGAHLVERGRAEEALRTQRKNIAHSWKNASVTAPVNWRRVFRSAVSGS